MSIFAPKQVVPAKTIDNFITFALRSVRWTPLEQAFSDMMHSSRAEKLLSRGSGLDEYLLDGINKKAAHFAKSILLDSLHPGASYTRKPNGFVGFAESYRQLVNNIYDIGSLLDVADDNRSLDDNTENARPSRQMCCLIIGVAIKAKVKKVVLDVCAQDAPNPWLDPNTLNGSVKYLRGNKWYDMETPPAYMFPAIMMRIKIHAGLAPAYVEKTATSTISFGLEKKVYQLSVEVAPPNPPKNPYEKITITLP